MVILATHKVFVYKIQLRHGYTSYLQGIGIQDTYKAMVYKLHTKYKLRKEYTYTGYIQGTHIKVTYKVQVFKVNTRH